MPLECHWCLMSICESDTAHPLHVPLLTRLSAMPLILQSIMIDQNQSQMTTGERRKAINQIQTDIHTHLNTTNHHSLGACARSFTRRHWETWRKCSACGIIIACRVAAITNNCCNQVGRSRWMRRRLSTSKWSTCSWTEWHEGTASPSTDRLDAPHELCSIIDCMFFLSTFACSAEFALYLFPH